MTELTTSLNSGIEQAEARAAEFAAAGLTFEDAFTSDLTRASHTAHILSSRCGGRYPKVDLRLRECHLGEFEGMQKADIYGPRYADLWQRLRSLPHPERVRTAYFDGLEAPLVTASRVAEAVVDAALSPPSDDAPPGREGERRVLLVTHSTIIESFLSALFGAQYDTIEMENLAWLELSLVPGSESKWRISLDRSHGVTYQAAPDAPLANAEPSTNGIRISALEFGPSSRETPTVLDKI